MALEIVKRELKELHKNNLNSRVGRNLRILGKYEKMDSYFDHIPPIRARYIEASIPVPEEKFQPMYRMMKWWARKPWWVIRKYIETYTERGDVVLDPFCGSGVVASEALILKRRVIAVDINPMATFITRQTCASVDLAKLSDAFKTIESEVKDEINKLYIRHCSKCGSIVICSRFLWYKSKPVSVDYECGKCKFSGRESISAEDIQKIEEVNGMELSWWFPKNKLLPKDADVRIVEELFTRRNLIALSILFSSIQRIQDRDVREAMEFTFCSMLPQATKMIMRLDTRGMGSWVIHRYWIPKEHFEMNVWRYFQNRYRKTLKGKIQLNKLIGSYFQEGNPATECDASCYILTKSSTNLSEIPSGSVDYVFTDPPYGGSIKYMELCTLWNSWLKFVTSDEEEIIINGIKKTYDFYQRMLTKVFCEVHRILKGGSYMSMTFHNRDLQVWNALLKACRNSGFNLVKIVPERPQAPSVSQLTQERSLIHDLVLTFQRIDGASISAPPPTELDPSTVIIETAKEVITRKRGATTTEIYDEIVPILYRLNLLEQAERDTLLLLEKNFSFREGKWRFRDDR